MRKWLGVALAGLVALACVATAQAKHYAVCSGLNQYKTSYVPSSNWLNGCVPDANNVSSNILQRGEWTSDTVTKLLNSNGTRAAIRKAITNAAAQCVSGDAFLYYHSSHGDTGCICTYDADYTADQMASDLAKFKSGVKVVVVIDACHSASMFKARGIKKNINFAEFAAAVSAGIDAIRAEEAARGIKSAKLSSSEIGWITAADSDQYSWDGDEGGAFTECFVGSVTSGACDVSPYGNGDSYATFKEMFDYAVAQDETHGDGDPTSEDYTMPQCTNTTILAAVTFGWVGKEEPSGVRFAPIPAQTATVGQALNYTVVATNSDGSSGKITYSVTSSAPSSSYSLNASSGVFSFTPATDGTFTFNFVGTNTTAHTSGKISMTVTASLAAPSSLANSGITDTSFTASWAAVPGAASYLLDVASSDFGGNAKDSGDDVLLSEDFAAFTGTAADRSDNLDTYLTGTGWTGSKVFENAGSAKLGSGNYNGWLATPALDLSSGGTVSFDLTQYGSSGDGNTVSVSIVADGSETKIGTATPGATTETVEFVIPSASASTSVKIATSAKRAIIDNLVVSSDGGADILSGQSVSGTSFTVTDLIPETYYWRVRAVGNAKGPFSETQEVTLMADPTAPPSIRPIEDIDVTVGQPATATVAVSAPEEAPVTSVTITDGDPSATLQDGVFSFTPVYPNTYSFTITAVNANGTATESFTVTATLADPAQPDTPATVGSDAFTAAWDPIPGAESYELDVVQGATSGGGGSGGGGAAGSLVLSEDFSGVTTSNTTTISNFDTVMKTKGWSGGYVYPAKGFVRLGKSGEAGYLQTPGLTVSGSLTVEWAAFPWTGDTPTVNVGVSTDGGATFTETGVALEEGLATYTTTFPVSGTSAIVRFKCATTSKHRFYLDSINIYSGSKARELSGTHLEGYPKNVGDVTSYIVSGLQPQTEYSFAIRAIAGDSVSEWSPAATVTTTEGPAAPAWSAIPAQTASIGYDFSIDLSAYVSGSPTPALSLTAGDATLTGTVLSFTPAAAQEYSFTVTASNDSGDADASFTVTAVDHVPTKYAVCVGINEYADINGLSGCVNDSLYMEANLIERGGWAAENVVRLNDKNATKDAIRSAISNVAAQAQAGDTFVYQHSSHGGQFNATEDDEDPLTGEEGKATFLCVYDEDYYDNTTAYNDYEIAADMAAFNAGVKVAVIVDACHSGGLFKSKDVAKASAASFDLAGRVTALMDADRTARKARGENVAKTLSSSEIGWATAAEYYEYSYDGGFYHTDEWLTNNVYGDEYYDEASEEYDYPPTYKQGGVFLASATWSWWNGTGDADADGLCDAYEFWQKGYDFCSVVGEFWYEDSTYNYYPQSTNIAVLKSIELGWIDDPRPAAPANPKASDVTASSFTASWDASENAVSYSLFVQKKVEAEAAPTARDGEEYQIDESFEGGEIPEGWTASTGVAIANGKGGDGTYCIAFKGAGATLVTPAVENPTGVSFMYKRSNNQATWGLDIAVGPSAEGPWTPVDSLEGAQTTWQTFSALIDASGTQYIQFTDARESGANERYIDLVQVTGSSGTWEDVAGFAPAAVAGTSKEVTGLDSDADYRFWVTATDAEGLESADSARVTLHTLAEDSAPVWSEIPELAAVAGVMGDFDAADYVTASPAATITLVSVTAPEGVTIVEDEDYQFEDGYLVFTPPAEGSYVFAFTAENDLGSADASLTVVAAGAPVTVPELTLDNATASSFDAAWTACTGASTYQFQVATDDQFTPGSAGGTFTLVESDAELIAGEYVILAENADVAMNNTCSGNSSGYLACTDVTVDGTTLSTEDPTIIWTLAGDATSCTLLNAAAGKYVNPSTAKASVGWADAASGSWTLSVSDGVVSMGNAASVSWKLQYNSNTPRFTTYNSTQKNLRFFRRGAKSAKDDGSLIVDETMSELAATVTDLDPETTYYARVRMTDGDWSAVKSITTLSAGPSAPVWLDIPEQTGVVGETFRIDLKPFVTGSPFPVILDTEDGIFTTLLTMEGTWTYELTASNELGIATTTLTVVVPGEVVTVPVLSLSNPTASTFDAAWTACTAASTYQFQVATDDQFTAATSGGTTVVFSNAATSVTAPENWTYEIGNTSGSYLQLKASENQVISAPVSTVGFTSLALTFRMRTYGGVTNTSDTAVLAYSTDGENWTELDSVTASSSTLTAQSVDASASAGLASVRYRWTCPGAASGKGVGIDRLVLTGEGAGSEGSIILDETTYDLGLTVTGLDPETTYYARVRMDVPGVDWSEVKTITTAASGGETVEITIDETTFPTINFAGGFSGSADTVFAADYSDVEAIYATWDGTDWVWATDEAGDLIVLPNEAPEGWPTVQIPYPAGVDSAIFRLRFLPQGN